MTTEHLKAFSDVPQAEVTGIFSRTRKRAEDLASKSNLPFVCDSVQELYLATKADLVVVSVPELSMNHVSKTCFDFPWTVLLEKPAGYNIADAESIFASAQSKKRAVFVALNRRFYSSTRLVKEDLEKMSGPRFIKIQDQQDQAGALAAGQPPEVVAHWMYANSIHLLDFLRFLGRGKLVAVKPIIRYDPSNPWMVVAEVEFDSGDRGLYEGVWKGPGPWAVSVQTREKRWEMRPLETASFQLFGKRTLEVAEIHPWDKQFKAGLRLQAEHAVLAAQGRPSDSATLLDSLESMKLVQKVFEN